MDEYRRMVADFQGESPTGYLFNPVYRELYRLVGEVQFGRMPDRDRLDPLYGEYEGFLESLLDQGMATEKDGQIGLTTKGVFFGNNIANTLISRLLYGGDRVKERDDKR